jgi:hypothetical protein
MTDKEKKEQEAFEKMKKMVRYWQGRPSDQQLIIGGPNCPCQKHLKPKRKKEG